MDNNYLAELLFPDVKATEEELEEMKAKLLNELNKL